MRTLARQGWKVWRLAAEMTLHDAAMTRFSQWWRRSCVPATPMPKGLPAWPAARAALVARVTSGLAMGPGHTLGDRAGLPAAGWLGLAVAIDLPVAGRAPGSPRWQVARENWLQAVFLVLGKFPEMLGQLKFLRHRFAAGKSALIEYK